MIRRLIILLLIVGCGFSEDLPPKSVLQKMTYDEKLNLYNRKKITFLKNALIGSRLPTSKREKQIKIIGHLITFPILVYGMFYKIEDDKDRKMSNNLINLGGTAYTISFFLFLHEREKQRELFNDRLYKRIFITT